MPEGRLIESSALGLLCPCEPPSWVAGVMLGQDGAAPAGRAARRQRAPAVPAGAATEVGMRVLARARAPEGVQPAQPAALERDHARTAQVGDARDLGPRVGPRGADAGAQREDAALGARYARQAALEAQDGAPQGAVAAGALAAGCCRRAADGSALRALAAGAVAPGRGRSATRRASCRWRPARRRRAGLPVLPGRRASRRAGRRRACACARWAARRGRDPGRRDRRHRPAGVETDGVETDGTDTVGVRTGAGGAGTGRWGTGGGRQRRRRG